MVRVRLFKSMLILAGVFAAALAWAQPPPEPPVDLGSRQAGQVHPFKLTAVNLNCQIPQDFRFVITGGDWLRAEGEPIARQVPQGQSRSIPAVIDLTGRAPGVYVAKVTIVCDTCQFLIFKNCKINDRNILVRVQAVAPPQPQPAQPPAAQTPKPGPVASPAGPSGGRGPGLLFEVPASARAALDRAQENERRARAAADKARADLDDARKKKGPCEEELAALRSAQAAAEAAASAAAAAAAAAQSEADKAQAAVDGFAGEMAAAERKMADTQKTLQQQAMARSIIGRESGTGSAAYAEAQAQVDKANDAVEAAQDAFRALRAQEAARKAAAEQAAAAAAKAASEAAAAQAAADAAASATAAKEKECLGLAAAEKAAEAKSAAAEGAADDAAEAARKEEEAARGAAVRSLEEELAEKRRHCAAQREAWRKLFERRERALKALQRIGALDPNAPTDGMDELWKDYVEQGYDVFMQGMATAAGGLVGGTPAPTAGGPVMLLGVLRATYGILAIRQTALTPGTYANLRDRMINGEQSSANAWVRSQGFAGDQQEAEEVLKEMDKIMDDPDILARDMARAMEEDRQCQAQIKELESKLAAAKGG